MKRPQPRSPAPSCASKWPASTPADRSATAPARAPAPRRPRWRLAAFGSLLTALTLTVPAASGAATRSADPAPYAGLGAWIDAFEYVPKYVQQLGPPPVLPQSIDDLAALGARTLYLQPAVNDPAASSLIVDRTLVGQMLRRAHARGLRVVAWYYPELTDIAADQARLDAIVAFRSGGQRFDGIALDIESNQVPDIDDRNRRLVALAQHLRARAGDRPIGAIVYPAVQLEVINPRLWPRFPYRALARSVDVWLPMTYWTFRDGVYRDAFRYTDESVQRLRSDLKDPRARVAPIGGLASLATPADYAAFGRAVHHDRAIGRSVFDANGTATTAWPYLRTAG